MSKPEHPSSPNAFIRSMEKFLEHLDVCKHCAENPFNLCDVGYELLKKAALAKD